MLSIVLIAVVLSGNLGFTFFARPVQAASVKSTGIKFTSCFVGGVLSSIISDQIQKRLTSAVNKVTNLISGKVDNAIDKAVTTGLNFVSGLFGFPHLFGSGTQTVTDPSTQRLIQAQINAWNNKQYRDDVIGRCIARTILNNMIGNINQVARTQGRDGGAAFIKNWVNFQTGAQYRGENIFRAELSTAHLCDYLATDVKKSFGVDPKTKTPLAGQNTRTDSLQPFSLSSKCTLPAGFSPENYNQDFTGNGGWDTFSRLLDPQNNIYGLTALSQDEIARQRALAVTADTTQAIANNGYLGISGDSKDNSCLSKGPTGECLSYKQIKTPGSLIGANISAGIQAEFNWITSAQSLDSIISTATEVMLNRMLDFGSPDEGDYRIAPTYDPTPEPLIILTPPPVADGGPGVPAPADAGTKHPSQESAVAAAKASVLADHIDISVDCPGRFEIVKRAAWALRSQGAGLLSKPSGSNCQGFAGDIIAFPDGYIYDVMNGTAADGAGPMWGPSGCGTNGTCADRYHAPIDPAIPPTSN